jgi:minor extracellular serine protease Vpr
VDREHGAEAVTYDLSFVNALSTGGHLHARLLPGQRLVAFGQPSVTVPAGGSASVSATINPATGPNLGQYGGYIVFTPQGGGKSIACRTPASSATTRASRLWLPASLGCFHR